MHFLEKTRFSPPNLHSNLVHRDSILQQLEASTERVLTLITASAGYGKTSLMSQYFLRLKKLGYPAVWLSADESDTDVGRFLFYITQAIRQHEPRFGDALLALLHNGLAKEELLVVPNLRQSISQLKSTLFLFIDDYYLAESKATRAIIRQILNSSGNLKLVIATRHKPKALPLSRLRVQGQIHEIDENALKFSSNEAGLFFRDCLDMPLKKVHSRLLSEKTEGWAAGMQLASITLKHCVNKDAFIESFTGEHPQTGEFIADEIIDRLSDDLRGFIIKCALFSRFNHQLCDSVFDSKHSLNFISRLRQDHLFVISLDNKGYWFRFHHLFSQYLQRRLLEEFGAEVESYYAKASTWHENNHNFEDAIEYAILANNHERAASLLDKISATLFYQGRISLLDRYANLISEEALQKYPSQQLDRIWQWITIWQFDKAKIALNQVRKRLDECRDNPVIDIGENDLDFLESKYAHREMSYAYFSDNFIAVKPLAESWLENHLNTDLAMVASAKSMLMASERDLYILAGVKERSAVLHDLHAEAKYSCGITYGNCASGATLFLVGELDLAMENFSRARDSAITFHGEYSPITAMPSLQMAEIYYEKNLLAVAQPIVDKYLPLSENFGFVENVIAGHLTRVRLALSMNNKKNALALIESGRKAAFSTGFERLGIVMLAEHIKVLLNDGNIKSAFSLIRASGMETSVSRYLPKEGSCRLDALQSIIWARLSAAMSNSNNAIRVLSLWLEFCKSREAVGDAIKIALTLAEIQLSVGDTFSTRRNLVYALETGAPRGFRRIFADEGGALRAEIEAIHSTEKELPMKAALSEIISCYSKPDQNRPRKKESKLKNELGEPSVTLSARELEVLIAAQDDKSNADIAESLSITVGTVKRHWQNIFEKLGVRRRRQAVLVATRLGFLG